MDMEISEPDKQTTDEDIGDLAYPLYSDGLDEIDYDDDDYECYHCTVDVDDDDTDSDYYIDDDDEQGHYRDSRFYGPDDELKLCICSFAGNFSWKEPSSGTSWIGVYGIGGTCSASMDKDALKRPTGHLGSTKILQIAVADMKDESSAICQRMVGHCSQTGSKTGPFAVVSIAPDACHVPLESNIEGAISFLMEKLKGRQSLTTEETEQIVVCAMKYLFGSVCRSSEMKTWCSGEFNWRLNPGQIEHHLNAIDWTTTTATKDLPASFSSLCISSSGSRVDGK